MPLLAEDDNVDGEEIRNAGLKVTLPRIKILDLLEKMGDQHLSAEDVYRLLLEGGEEIGLATVYRVLTQFESAGLVTRHHFEGGLAVFELNRGGHHDHIVCVSCGRVEEFFDETIERRQQEIAAEKGFTVEDHALTIYGHCRNPRCKAGRKG
jgi:Fur family ferric uptake transcriptional regulator